ncbi:hypothetical protein SEQ01_17910 [Streptococcus equinus]|uniref:hypothetical protein n=1 Tax=Streptococcus equinus TaxID=1335 RepID=UPI001144FACF|nr:hypothetical protein [Streptococcus equinus]GEB11600.1 hypothetical protein SEQ01_17910 [Streptococcus equinus]
MTTRVQYLEIKNLNNDNLYTIHKRALEIEDAYGIGVGVKVVKEECIKFYMTITTALTTIQDIEEWYSERFQDSSEYDSISRIWQNGPRDLNDALDMILIGLSDLTSDWLLYGGE